MPANVTSGMYNKQTGVPWHGLGTMVEEALPTAEAAVVAGVDFQTHTEEIQTVSGYPVPGRLAVVREGDLPIGAKRVLGDVSKNYVDVPPQEVLDFADGLIADGRARWDTLMALKGGEIICGVLKLESEWTVLDDLHYTYMAIQAGYNGAISIGATPTSVRVVCDNTRRLAFGNGEGSGIVRIRHTRNVREKMMEAQNLLHVTTEQERNYKLWLEQIAAEEVESTAMNQMLMEIFGDPDKAETPRIGNAIKARTNGFKAEFLAKEVMFHGQTGYSVFQALTGYADHGLRYNGKSGQDAEHGKAEARYLSTIVGGRSTALKNKAVEMVSFLTGVATD